MSDNEHENYINDNTIQTDELNQNDNPNDEVEAEEANNAEEEEDMEFLGPDVIIDGVNYGLRADITKIEVPDGTTSLDEGTFEECINLASVILPPSLLYIGEAVFFQCSSLVEINIPDSLTSIKRGAFAECSSLVEIKISRFCTIYRRVCLRGMLITSIIQHTCFCNNH